MTVIFALIGIVISRGYIRETSISDRNISPLHCRRVAFEANGDHIRKTQLGRVIITTSLLKMNYCDVNRFKRLLHGRLIPSFIPTPE